MGVADKGCRFRGLGFRVWDLRICRQGLQVQDALKGSDTCGLSGRGFIDTFGDMAAS